MNAFGDLSWLGWGPTLDRAFEPWAATEHVQPARVVIAFNYIYRVTGRGGDAEAELAGRLKHQATHRGELPAVGDWVVVRRRPEESRGAIVALLPRHSRFSRRMAGQVTGEQIVAANVDAILIVMGLDEDFSVRRLERYLALARRSGAAPIVLLTKPDLCQDVPSGVAAVQQVAAGVPVHVLNPRLGEGLDHVTRHLSRGQTGALLGSSGVGKSTIINRLVGHELLRTQETRAKDAKGRHTTTHRELVALPGGGLLIDTPGMRELQLWDAEEGVGETFDEIDALAPGCHFANCRHREEPRCAVKAAVEEGRLDAGRLESYRKLQAEMAHLARQQDERGQIEEKRRSKVIGKALKQYLKSKRE